MSAIESPAVEPQEPMRIDLDRLVSLIEQSQIDEARDLAHRLIDKWPDSAPIQHLHHVLQPPEVTSTCTPARPTLEREWACLRDHAQEYPGCWLAVHDDRLLAASPDREHVLAAAREALGSDGAFLFFQPAAPP
jgi:hypothetical protein